MAIIIRYLFVLTIGLIVIKECSAQVFNVKSLDEANEQVHIVPDYLKNTLIITCLTDTIRVSEFVGIKGEISVLNGQILKVVYKLRSGSNITRGNLLLLCINQHKLYQAAQIAFFSTYDVDMVYNQKADAEKLFDEHGDYHLKVNLKGSDKSNYQLDVNIHDEIRSKHDPKTNHNYDSMVTLNFDPDRCVFFNGQEDLSQYFTVYDPKTQRGIKQYLMGTYPVIKLGGLNYYYIKNDWY